MKDYATRSFIHVTPAQRRANAIKTFLIESVGLAVLGGSLAYLFISHI